MVAVVGVLRDVRVDREIIRLPSWIGAEAAQLIDGISRGAGGSWDAQIKLHSPSDAIDAPIRPPNVDGSQCVTSPFLEARGRSGERDGVFR